MTVDERDAARADIESTNDLLERAMKLAGLLTAFFRERGFSLAERLADLRDFKVLPQLRTLKTEVVKGVEAAGGEARVVRLLGKKIVANS